MPKPAPRKADPDVLLMVGEVLAGAHPHLAEAGVTVRTEFHYANRKDGVVKGHALKWRGLTSLSRVDVVSLDWRSRIDADVILKLDGDRWRDVPPDQQRAIIDMRLESLEVVLEDEDNAASIKRDDLARPILRVMDPDAHVEVYHRVVERHGKAAPEVSAMNLASQQVLDAIRTHESEREKAAG